MRACRIQFRGHLCHPSPYFPYAPSSFCMTVPALNAPTEIHAPFLFNALDTALATSPFDFCREYLLVIAGLEWRIASWIFTCGTPSFVAH